MLLINVFFFPLNFPHFRRNYQRNMRKLDLSQKRNGIIKVKKDDPVLAHYDRKMDYVLPKIRLDAISKRKNMIEYTNEFEDR